MRGGQERVYKKGGKEDESGIGMGDKRGGVHGRAGEGCTCVTRRERRRKEIIQEIQKR